jgi:hypothetical protein
VCWYVHEHSRYTADDKAVQNVFSISISMSCEQAAELTVSLMCVHLEPSVQILHRNSLIMKHASGKLSGNLQGEKAASGSSLSSLLLYLRQEKGFSDGSVSSRRT